MTAAEVDRGQYRRHWGIENKSHYVRDTFYREDHSQAWAWTARRPWRPSATSHSGYSA